MRAAIGPQWFWKAIDFSIKTERLSLAKQRDTPAVHRSFRDPYYIA